jgi:hypothetical protein
MTQARLECPQPIGCDSEVRLQMAEEVRGAWLVVLLTSGI